MYKILNCIIFILSSALLAKCRPVPIGLANSNLAAAAGEWPKHSAHLPLDKQRSERQVVQPIWLADDENFQLFPYDGKVRLTPENLAETAELRDEINKAVEEGRYYVDVDQEDQNPSLLPSWYPLQPRQSGFAPLAPWPQQQPRQQQQPQPAWPMLIELPTLAPLDDSQPNLLERMWSDFMENTRRFFDIFN